MKGYKYRKECQILPMNPPPIRITNIPHQMQPSMMPAKNDINSWTDKIRISSCIIYLALGMACV